MKRGKITFYGGLIYSDRALLYNGSLKTITDKYDVELWTQYANLYESSIVTIKNVKLVGNLNSPWYLKYLRYLNTKAHDLKHQSKARFYGKKKMQLSFPKSLINNFLNISANLIYILNFRNYFEKIVSKIHKNKVIDLEFEKFLKDSQPDIVVLTWPYRASNLTLVSICKKMGIKTIASVLGIDNLTTKERMLDLFDYYWVWSDYMKNQLLEYYPSIKARNIFVSGPIQYNGLFRFSNSSLINIYSNGRSINKINILFCLGSPNLIEEHHVLFELLNLIWKRKLNNFYSVLIRPHPGFNDNAAHLEGIKKAIAPFDSFCEVQEVTHIINDTFMKQWSSAIYYSNIVLACYSTILIDAVILHKRTYNVNFSTDQKTDELIKNEISKWVHNIDMVNNLPVKSISNVNELDEMLTREYQNPNIRSSKKYGNDEINKIKKFVGVDLSEDNVVENLGTRYVNVVENSIESLINS